MDDEDDDEEEYLLDYSLTVDEVKNVITNDFTNAKNENTKDVEATKTYISNLVMKCDFLNLCHVQNEEQDDVVDEYVKVDKDDDDEISLSTASRLSENNDPPGLHKVLRRSMTAFKEKAKVDMQVVHLLDQEDIKETTLRMHELLRGSFGRKMKRNHKQTKKQIELNKVTFEGTVKDIATANSINNHSDVDTAVGSLVKVFAEKSTEDFEDTNKKIQELTHVVKSDFSEYVRTTFPLPHVTEEEICSEEFVKRDILYLKDRLANDLEQRKKITDRSIVETKTRIEQIPGQILDGLKNLPSLPMRLLKDSNAENIEKELYVISDNASESFVIHPVPNEDVTEETNEH